MLNTRLAAADSMTHDVIRDLLGVKLDITNYAVSFRAYIRLLNTMEQLVLWVVVLFMSGTDIGRNSYFLKTTNIFALLT